MERVGRGFSSAGSGWRPLSGTFRLSSGDFLPIDPGKPYPESRGVFEYQGMAHDPGLFGGAGGWVAA